jgi:hypothetical protein
MTTLNMGLFDSGENAASLAPARRESSPILGLISARRG